MKTVNWNSSRVRNLVDHETPCREISLPDDRTIRMWWTSGKGATYGPQVLAVIYGGEDVVYTFTDGCGYDKEYAALEECFAHLGKMPRGFVRGDQQMHKFHVGGNYYRVPVKDWLRWR